MTTVSGRSAANAASGCQPTASAAEEASSQSGIPNAAEWVFAYGEVPTMRGSQLVWALGRYGDIYGPLPFAMFQSDAWTGNMFYGSQDLIAWAPCLGPFRDFVRYDASAIEAQRATTPQSGVVHESAGPQDDAHV